MPDFSTEIDIDAWDYISACSNREVKELIEALVENGHLDSFNGQVKPVNTHNTLMDDEWWTALVKLRDSRHLLSPEDENRITDIAKKLV
jgi:hypothetical protein